MSCFVSTLGSFVVQPFQYTTGLRKEDTKLHGVVFLDNLLNLYIF